MRISGSGKIPAGEYEKIRISGSARLEGLVRCESFHVSGSAGGDAVECKKEIHISGSCSFKKRVIAESMSVSGSFSCEENVMISDKLACSGGGHIKGAVKCGSCSIAGGLSVEGDLEAETVTAHGKLNCAGLLNAEEIHLYFDRGMKLGNVGGSTIEIQRWKPDRGTGFWKFLSYFQRPSDGTVQVLNSIEGDQITLEGVIVPCVSGRDIKIGAGCHVNLVQYTDQVEISPEAIVERVEKREISYN